MSKKYFDLGARNISDFWDMYRYYKSGRKENRADLCNVPYIICYRNHKESDCERKKLLGEFMWTKSR